VECPKCRSKSVYTHGFYGSQRTPRFKCRSCRKTFSARTNKPCAETNLSDEKLYQILNCLTEGCSVRTTSRLCGVHLATVLRVLNLAGERCEKLMQEKIKGVEVRDVQADELWGFVYCKQKTKPFVTNDDPTFGDAYAFVALEKNTKLVLAWHLGRRTQRDTYLFTEKLHEATEGRFQLTTDGFSGYPDAVAYSLGTRVSFSQCVKVYRAQRDGVQRYSPAAIKEMAIYPRWGNPDPDRISTSHVERVNLTIRMNIRRMTRLTNGFSRKWENLKAALALFFFDYNFRRVHRSISCTPAMASGVTSHIWEWKDLFSST
jgi:transposase-like protein/IS1 family transposase